ncbi:unnamed protein product [Parajaminaea phylloscopi]
MSFNTRARAHKSTKVPGVKLRPKVQALPADNDDGRQDDRDATASEDGDDEEDENTRKPLAHTIITFTGLSDLKTELIQKACSMGATVEGNLTEDTSHLIAAYPGSQKYHCAMRLGLYILVPEFIEDLHERWKNADEDIGMAELLDTHSLRPLQDLRVGLCGISERNAKKRALDSLREAGADVVFPITFDTEVAVLFCGVTSRQQSSTLDTIYQLRKGYIGSAEERRGANNIRCVIYEYLEDCLRVGGLLDPDDEEKYNTWNQRGKRITQDERNIIVSSYAKRTPSAMHKRIRRVQAVAAARRAGIEERLAAERLAAQAGADQKQAAALRTSLAGVDAFMEQEPPASTVDRSRASVNVLARPRDVTEGDAQDDKANSPKGEHQSQTETRNEDQAQGPSRADGEGEADVQPEQRSPSPDAPLHGLTVRVDVAGGKNASRHLLIRSALLGAGATVLAADDRSKEADYCIVPETVGFSDAPAQDSQDHWVGRGEPVTYFWLEQCLFYGIVIDPSAVASSSQQPYLRPPGVDLPMKAAKAVVVAITGFVVDDSTPERTQVTKALEAAGCKVTETFAKRSNTHLLSSRIVSEEDKSLSSTELRERGWLKEAKAQEWGIPLVGFDWLKALWTTGTVTPMATSSERQAVEGAANESINTLGETQIDLPSAGTSRDLADIRQGTEKKLAQPDVGVGGQDGVGAGNTKQGIEDNALPAPVPPPVSDAAALNVGGSSMYIARLGQDVAALFSATKRGAARVVGYGLGAADSTEAVKRGREATDDLRSTRSISVTHGASKIGGKLPPKSRRSTAAATAAGGRPGSPSVGRRSTSVGSGRASSSSVSPVKRDSTDAAARLGTTEEEEASAGQLEQEEDSLTEASRILALQREAEARRDIGQKRVRLEEGSISLACRSSQQPQVLAPLATQSHHHRSSIDESADAVQNSMKITYRDPQSEKARKILEELLSRSTVASQASDAVADGSVVEAAPESETQVEEAVTKPAAAKTDSQAKGKRRRGEGDAGGADISGREEMAIGADEGEEENKAIRDVAGRPAPAKKIQARRQPGSRR